MLTVCSSTENCFSKDARNAAPSVTLAHNCGNSYDVVFVTGIAVAVSVFLYALISIICCVISYGIMIHIISSIILSVIIITGIIINIFMIMRIKKNLNTKAKLCFTQF